MSREAYLHSLILSCSNNCNYKTFGPYWGFPGIVKKTGGMQYTSCATLQTTNYEFLANERFLDWHINDDPFCEGFRYLVSIRDILDHRISIRNTLWKDTYAGQAGGRRLVLQTELVSREYYHWALLAGRSTQKERYRPVPSDYDMAKRTLMGFDFLVDFTKPSSECNHLVLKLLDFPQTFWKENVRNSVQKDQMAARHNRTHLLETNPLDLHLYNFSQQLMEIDCEFFRLLLERQKKWGVNSEVEKEEEGKVNLTTTRRNWHGRSILGPVSYFVHSCWWGFYWEVYLLSWPHVLTIPRTRLSFPFTNKSKNDSNRIFPQNSVLLLWCGCCLKRAIKRSDDVEWVLHFRKNVDCEESIVSSLHFLRQCSSIIYTRGFIQNPLTYPL